jgi:type IV pilus assembly protein PilY1
MRTIQHTSNLFRLSLLTLALVVTPVAQAASVALATSPLATSTTSTVKPNLTLIIDNSGSMDWDHMPDDNNDGGSSVTFDFGYYGLRSSQCNQVYYNSAITYLPPLYADGTSYPNATFTAAKSNGFDSGSSTVNLSTSFKASLSRDKDATAQPAYYYKYSGTQTTQLQKNYHSTTNTFFSECSNKTATGITYDSNSSGTYTGTAPASGVGGVFTKVTVSATSGPGGTDERTNFANWYSYYSNRMLMMKTATGRAFSNLNNSYRIGMMKISQTSPVVYVNTFEGAHRTSWYSTLYNMSTDGSTPLRRALSDAGRYYAGKLSGTDPVQYSCQQNFTILSTDGYWNTGDGYKLDGSTPVGNQDGTAGRPMFDGSITTSTWTNIYTRNNYSSQSDGLGNDSRCDRVGGGSTPRKLRLVSQPEICSCTVTTSGAECAANVCSSTGSTGWSSSGSKVYVSPYTSNISTCAETVTLPTPDPSTRVLQSSGQNSTGGSSDNLADIAMYYYQTDLRTTDLDNCTGAVSGVNVCTNNVFIGGNDNNLQQHMTTFTLGLGASGKMNYSSSYLTDTSGDYVAVKLGSPADSTATPPICPWQADDTVCNWPVPGMSSSNGLIENIDDLWHAAVNGRGAYFSATDPASLSSGLSNALAGINARKGAAAAAATSTLNPVAGNNYAFVASYTTVAWKGNLEARGINTNTGAVSESASWCLENVVAGNCPSPGTVVAEDAGDTTAYYCVTPNSVICNGGILDGSDCKVQVATSCSGTMSNLVGDVSDTRTIKTASSNGTALIDFDYANLTATQKSYFSTSHISALSQWTGLDGTQKTAAAGENLVNYLRGQYGYEDRTANAVANRLYRYREAVLGDALESEPAFMGPPVFNYPYPGYSSFKSVQANRDGVVYMGTNDGMMHAFYAQDSAGVTPPCVIGATAGEHCGGEEAWAYVPSMVIPNLWKLADTNYATQHTNYVNGSPITSDVCTANCSNTANAVWKTIMVASLNGGGRGYYALDITDPASPALLWELTTTAGIGAIKDDDVGYSFGHPIITRKEDGTWVVIVTSGYNNTSPGDGKGYLYVLNASTGAIISKIATGVGDTTTPSGLSHIVGWNNESAGNLVGYVYGGDLLGNLWRFNINDSSTTATIGTGSAMLFATLKDSSGVAQPITTTPTLGKINEKRVVFVGTGKYLETSDLITTQQQTIYAIKDDDASSTLVNARTSLQNQTLTNNPDGTATRLSSGNTVNFYTGRGWYIDLPDTGERVNIDSTLVQGTLIVPTIVPSNTVCSPGGYGWLNFLDYKTGGAIDVSTNLSSVKLDSTIVGVNVLYIQGQPKVGVVTSTNPTPTLIDAVEFAANAPSFSGKRVIWRELIP